LSEQKIGIPARSSIAASLETMAPSVESSLDPRRGGDNFKGNGIEATSNTTVNDKLCKSDTKMN